MTQISLAAYAVQIHEYRAPRGTFEQLGNFGGNDFLPFFDRFARGINTRLGTSQKLARARQATIVTNARTVAGICECGNYGFEAEGVDSRTGATRYHRRTTDAELLPFYFFADLPARRDVGLLLLQRFGQFGMRGAFAGALIPEFENAFRNYRLTVDPITSATAWQRYFANGEMNVVRFIRYDVPPTPEDVLDPNAGRQEGYTELSMHARRFRHLPYALQRFIPGTRPVSGIIQLPGFRYDTIKVDIDLQGTRRTFDLGHLLERMVLDVTAAVVLGQDGHPTFASIHPIAQGYARDVRAEMGQNVP